MLRLSLASLTLIGLFLLTGCGGSSITGKNSDIVVHLLRTDGTQVMTRYEIYMTKGGDTGLNVNDPEDFASTLNQPSWIDTFTSTRSATELAYAFRTRSDQVPYFIFVKVPNTGANFETLKLQIDVDGTTGAQKTYDLNINSTQRVTGVRINRNSATY